MRVAFGTQGWAYADWTGVMYDSGARAHTYLPAYAEEFDTVEIDSTFYGVPAVRQVEAWASAVPRGFTFACKLPREITHERRMLAARGLIREFYYAARGFGEKLACVLVQFDASYGRSEEPTFVEALAAFPAGVRTAFEFRDPAWYAPDVQALLEARGFALAVADAPFVPRDALADVLARTQLDFAYVRLIGARDAVTRYDRVQIERGDDIAWWAQRIGSASPRLRQLFAYANNHYQGHGPATARALYAALAIERKRPERVRQTSLF